MAVLANVNPTFLDLTKQLDPDGTVADIAEVLNQTNEGLDEVVWTEGNGTDGHRHTIRTGLPSATWGRLSKGVLPSKGDKAQITDNSGFLESLSEVDSRLVELAPDPMKFRFNEDRPHIEAMSQELFATMFNGGFGDPDKFVGFRERFSDPLAGNGVNLINAGSVQATADKTSIWLIGWSPRTVFMFVPKGTKSGLIYKDAGLQWVTDEVGGRYEVYRSYWRWNAGLAVADWRYAIRMPNIRLSELTADGATGPKLPYLLRDMIERLPSDAFNSTRLAFYMNRRVVSKIATQLEAKITNSTLSLDTVGAVGMLSPRRKLMFDGIPINRIDTLAFNEPLVTGFV